jgi:catechol 2,3-dioxygenase-like lactoylglutathione lyase family enzyme
MRKINGCAGEGAPPSAAAAPEKRKGLPRSQGALWLVLLFVWMLSSAQAHPLPRATSASLRPFAAARPQPAQSDMVEAVDAIGMTVSDMDASVKFYAQVLSFEKVSDVEVTGEEYEQLEGVFGLRMRVVRMKLGAEFIELTQYLAPEGRPIPIDSRSNDRWFQHIAIVTSDMERAYAHLRQNKVRHVSTSPQRLPDWNRSAGGIKAFYFKDPDGHALELLWFPAGKGAVRWHTRPETLFLGIDHTAIVVNDTSASLRFYRDVLGFAVVGASENYGPEQEHLNNVRGARLRITSLRAPKGGPGIELLDYLAPRNGRPAPADTGANDLWHWQTSLVSRRLDQVATKLRAYQHRFISAGVVTLPAHALGFSRGLIVRDPDGHAMLLLDDTGPACQCRRRPVTTLRLQQAKPTEATGDARGTTTISPFAQMTPLSTAREVSCPR